MKKVFIAGSFAILFITHAACASEPAPQITSAGDSRIRVIPSAHPYSVKNGEKLSLSVIVNAPAGVAAVTADLGRIETIALAPSSVTSDSTGHPISGLWTAEWTGHHLEEKVYDITLRVSDLAGHSVEDKSLHFSDPAAGLSTPGTAAAPTSSIREIRSDAIFHDQDQPPFCACYDAAQGEALFGTFGTPSQIIKVKVNGPSGVPERIGRITLNTGEDFVHSACYDPATKIALIGASPSLPKPGVIVKIAMGAPGQLPSRIGAVTLNTGETSPYGCVYDPTNQVALFTTLTNPSIVVKVAMNAPTDAPTRVSALTLQPAESVMRTGIIDTANGVALFATDTVTPGSVVKVAVNGPTDPPIRVGSVFLNADDNGFESSAFDAANNVALFAMHSYPASGGATIKLVKIALNAPGAAPTRVASLDLNVGEDIGQMSEIVNGTVLLATDTAPSTIIKCNVGAAGAAPTRVGAVTLNPNEQRAISVITSGADNVALFVCSPAGRISPVITKVSFGSLPADPPARVNALPLFIDENGSFCALYDQPTKRALFVSNSGFASVVIKVAFDSPDGIPRRVGAIQLNDGETSIQSAVYDAAGGTVLLPTSTSPARAVKIAFGAAEDPPVRVGAVTLNTGENFVQSCVLDAANGIALLGTVTNPAIVVKVALNAPAAAPTRVGALTLNAGERNLVSAVADPANGVALFGSSLSSAGTIIKVAFGLPADPPTRVGSLVLTNTESAFYGAVIDIAHNVALFQADKNPNVIVKVALNNPGDAPTKVNSTTLAAGENGANGGTFDTVSGTAFFTTFDSPSHVIAVAAGLATDAPARLSGTALKTGENVVSAIIVDPATQLVYTASKTAPAKVSTLPYTPRSTLNATRMTLADMARVTDLRFYSHAAAGNLRLAIYDNSTDKKLLWSSNSTANTAANADLVVPISAGTPTSLVLMPGTYFLAWQSDSVTPVASFTAGAAGDGFSAIQPFGAYPTTLTAAAQTATPDRYTEYITYAAVQPSTLTVNPSIAGIKQVVAFTLVETVLDPNLPLTYTWDFGDGGSGTGATPTHQYAASGTYMVTVTVSDGQGGMDVKSTSVTVVDPVLSVSADPSEAFTAVPVDFDAAAFFYTGNQVSYAWNFGDSGSATGAAPSHTFAASGTYTVTVTATETLGGATITDTVTVHVTTVPIMLNSGPTASANPAGVGQQITFTASASAAPGLTITYMWDFGDGTNATGPSVTHTYAAPNDYIVKVTAADGTGSTAVGQITLSVLGPVIGSGTLDTDGDGFSDGFETDNATLPANASSTPFDNTSAINFTALTIIKPSIALNFKKANSDSVKFSGTLEIPDGFNGNGQSFYVVVGDNLVKFTLNAKFSAKTAAGSVKLTIKVKKGVPITRQTGKYAVSLSKGAFAAKLAPYGLTGDANIKVPVTRVVPFALFFNNQTLQKRVTMLYTAKAGASGKASAK